MSTKSWQDVLLEVVEADPADFTDRKNICISPKDLGEILRAALQERDALLLVQKGMQMAIDERDAEIAELKLAHKANTTTMLKLLAKHKQHAFNNEAQRKVLGMALEAILPVAGYGRVGSKDIEQAALQAAVTAIQGVLES
jgi:hypothetical protein